MTDPKGHLSETDSDARELEKQLDALIDADAPPEQLVPMVEGQEAADAADTLERLEQDGSREVLRRMENEKAADALTNMAPALASTMVVDLLDIEGGEASEIVGLMGPDDAADIVQLLAPDARADLLAGLHPRQAAEIGKLALYDPETAGGLMTTDILVVRDGLTIGGAIEVIKRKKINEEQPYVYVVDKDRALAGLISLRDLLVKDDADLVREHMETEAISVRASVDQEDIARLFERYDLLTLPVADEAGRILGMITIDDIIDTIREEHTEDALKQVGAGSGEAVYSGVRTKIRGRMPWLVVNLCTATLAAMVVLAFTDMIELVPVAAMLLSIIANQAGNTGFQSLAVTLRGLTLQEIHPERVAPLVIREAGSGAFMGLGVGLLMCLGIMAIGSLAGPLDSELLATFSWRIGLIAGAAMTVAMSASALIGTMIPIFMNKIGADPATASSIFLVTFTDSTSFAAFLGLIYVLRGWIVSGPALGEVLGLAI